MFEYVALCFKVNEIRETYLHLGRAAMIQWWSMRRVQKKEEKKSLELANLKCAKHTCIVFTKEFQFSYIQYDCEV